MIAYSKILNENEIVNFVNKFAQIVSHKIFLSVDEYQIDLGVHVYGILVGLGGINVAQQIEENVTYCINTLNKPEKRYASIMMLLELIKHAQFITFNKIRKYNITDLFKSIILEKKQNYRKKGLELIDECVKEICKRDKSEQTNMLSKIFNDIFKERQLKHLDSDINFGVVTVLKCLLTYSNKEIFNSDFTEICEFISMLRTSKTVCNQLVVMEMYPILARYNHELFNSGGFLNSSVAHIFKVLNSHNYHFKKPAHNALSKIFNPYHSVTIEDKAKEIFSVLFQEFRASSNKNDTNLLSCMVSVAEKLKLIFLEFLGEPQVHELINLLLINGISEDIMSFLTFLFSTDLKEIAMIIEIKLLYTISYILNNNRKFYNFEIGRIPQDQWNRIEIFQENLHKNLQGTNKEVNNEELICVSLNCLSRFEFPTFRDQMVDLRLLGRFCQ